MVDRLRTVAEQIPDAAADVRDHARSQGLRGPFLDKLAAELAQRALRCRADL